MKNYVLFVCLLLVGTACVSKKQYLSEQAKFNAERKEANTEIAKLKLELERLREKQISTNSKLETEKGKNQSLNREIEHLQGTNKNLLNQLEALSVISKGAAKNIEKSLETISQQSDYIKSLNQGIQRRDSINMVLANNIKRSLNDLNDDDIKVEVKKGVVYISLSDKLLFKSGSSNINEEAKEVLGKIAQVVNDHKDLDILVEGHTDDVPVSSSSSMKDNWDLSVKRATSIVRTLQTEYNVAPERMTAGGRSSYVPKADNTTKEGRAMNRRSEIIILPKLDQFFKLLEAPSN